MFIILMFICYIFKKRFAFLRFSKKRLMSPSAPVPGDGIACHQ